MFVCTLYFIIIYWQSLFLVLEVPVPVLRSELILLHMLQEWAPRKVRPAGLPRRVVSMVGLPFLQGCCGCCHCQCQAGFRCYHSCSQRPWGAQDYFRCEQWLARPNVPWCPLLAMNRPTPVACTVYCIFSAHTHASLPHCTKLTKLKLEDWIIKIFKKTIAEH